MASKNYLLDLIIPVYNEGESIKQVLKLLDTEVKAPIRVLICYDFDEDNTLKAIEEVEVSYPIKLIKNRGIGAHGAIITGFDESDTDCLIVFPGDDVLNQIIIDDMYNQFLQGCEIVVASRFVKGGSMTGCPFLKSVFVRTASFTLFFLSSIPVRDASNGFRLFSKKLLQHLSIESTEGFTFSLELLVKCERLKWMIGEVPAQWAERKIGKSRFKLLHWLPKYLQWYFYGLATTWLNRGPDSVRLKQPIKIRHE